MTVTTQAVATAAVENRKPTIDFKKATAALQTVFIELFPAIGSGGWTNWSDADQESLIRLVHKMYKVVDVRLLPPFNKSVWDGEDEGKVTLTIEGFDSLSTRARRKEDAEKPGRRKATPKTTEELFESL